MNDLISFTFYALLDISIMVLFIIGIASFLFGCLYLWSKFIEWYERKYPL